MSNFWGNKKLEEIIMNQDPNELIPMYQEKEIFDIIKKENLTLKGEIHCFSEEEDSLKKAILDKVDFTLNNLRNYAPHIANIFKNLKGEEVICITADTIKKMKEVGADFLPNSGKNALSPMLRKAGKIVGHADLEKRVLPNSNLASALAMTALAQQIAALQRQLEDIQETLDIVLQGQWDDRFAKIDAAKNELFLALHTKDENLKRNLLSNAINLSCQGNYEISRSLKTEIDYIDKLGMFSGSKKAKKRIENIIEHIPHLFNSWNTQMVLLQECKEYEALKQQTLIIYKDIDNLFTKQRIELLRDNTLDLKLPIIKNVFASKKIKNGKKFWTDEFPKKIQQTKYILEKINKQSDCLINLKTKNFIIEEIYG